MHAVMSADRVCHHITLRRCKEEPVSDKAEQDPEASWRPVVMHRLQNPTDWTSDGRLLPRQLQHMGARVPSTR